MPRIFQILILAALTFVVIPSFPASSSAATLLCESGKDCPIGEFCSARPHHKAGHCVGGFSTAAIGALLCGDSSDCPIGRFCRIKSGRDVGHCVSH